MMYYSHHPHICRALGNKKAKKTN